MNIEKRNSGTEPAAESVPETKNTGKKPVIIYIMILFIVAFLLMALSFFMHQRSNSEVLGQMQDSVNAMQALQTAQEKIISLQDELAQSQDHIDKLNEDVENLRKEMAQQDAENDALLQLRQLQQLFDQKNTEACKTLIGEMEEAGAAALLPQEGLSQGLSSPAQQYTSLKEAVLGK